MPENLVWYVCYGSNLCFERLMCYLTGAGSLRYGVPANPAGKCEDPNPPTRNKVVALPYPLYFARNSRTWNGGVAFIDPSHRGVSIGRAYLITRAQFQHIKRREGAWYQKEVTLDAIEGIPAVTFTDETTQRFVKPSDSYLRVIKDGLLECGIPESFVDSYIKASMTE